MNVDREVYEIGSIFIENNIIKNVGKFDINIVDKDVEIYDVKGKILMLGLVNIYVYLF